MCSEPKRKSNERMPNIYWKYEAKLIEGSSKLVIIVKLMNERLSNLSTLSVP